MRQELDAHRLARIWRHVHGLVDESRRRIACVEDGLQNVAVAIGDIGVLPVERNTVSSTVLMPEAQDTGTSRNGELLIEGAVPERFGPFATATVRCTVAAAQR